MSFGTYILEGKTPVRCDNMRVWCKWMDEADRRVARDEIDGILISTVFLGIDHNFDDGPPILFETMVFDDVHKWLDNEMRRYCTWDEAEQGHRELVEEIKARLATGDDFADHVIKNLASNEHR
jgi:hypothetical protein